MQFILHCSGIQRAPKWSMSSIRPLKKQTNSLQRLAICNMTIIHMIHLTEMEKGGRILIKIVLGEIHPLIYSEIFYRLFNMFCQNVDWLLCVVDCWFSIYSWHVMLKELMLHTWIFIYSFCFSRLRSFGSRVMQLQICTWVNWSKILWKVTKLQLSV